MNADLLTVRADIFHGGVRMNRGVSNARLACMRKRVSVNISVSDSKAFYFDPCLRDDGDLCRHSLDIWVFSLRKTNPPRFRHTAKVERSCARYATL